MGHFEKGAGVKDPFDGLNNFASNLPTAFSKLADSLQEWWNAPTGKFKKGTELTRIQLIGEVCEKFNQSILNDWIQNEN